MRLAGVSLVLLVAGVVAAHAARPGTPLDDLHALQARTHRALLELYALDSQLHAASRRVAALEAQAVRLRREQAALAQQLSATRRTLAVSQTQLARNLSVLYKQGDVSALAVVLGAQSLDDALTRLDDLDRVAGQSEHVVAVTSKARRRLVRLRASLAHDRVRLDTALAGARRTEAIVASARSHRLAYVADLRRREHLRAAQIRALEQTAQRVVRKADALAPEPAADVGAAPSDARSAEASTAPASPGRTMVVAATGYSLSGHTATGMPVGWGVAAVDPSVIPLGARVTVPGYGDAVAADVGSGVRGAEIDLWFPTLAQARAWGRRTVTVTLH